MQTTKAAIFSATLLFSALPVGAEVSADVAEAKLHAPGVQEWTKVAEGLYEGSEADGSHVKFYSGAEGARIRLSEFRAELRQIEATLTDLSLGRGSNGAKSGADRIEKLGREAEALQHQIRALGRVALDQENDAVAKATQTRGMSGVLCQFDVYGTSVFTATGIAGSSPTVGTTIQDSTGWIQPAPPGPLPYATLRQATSRVWITNYSVDYDSDYKYSYDHAVSLSALATYPSSSGACFMRSRHAMQAKCQSTDPWAYWELERDQTCSGVLAGTEPVVNP